MACRARSLSLSLSVCHPFCSAAAAVVPEQPDHTTPSSKNKKKDIQHPASIASQNALHNSHHKTCQLNLVTDGSLPPPPSLVGSPTDLH